jgi:hypothetical protein
MEGDAVSERDFDNPEMAALRFDWRVAERVMNPTGSRICDAAFDLWKAAKARGN